MMKRNGAGVPGSKPTKIKRLYLIPVLTKALDILEVLQSRDEAVSLEAVHKSTGISKTTVYRILKTFVHRGYVAQTGDGGYISAARPKKLRFGFGGLSAEMPFSRNVTASLQAAAQDSGIDLLVLDNCYDAQTAIENADRFIRERVDVVIEFQVEESVAPVIGDKISAARIPLIAVDIPHPHSTYFGVDNYRAGFEGGVLLSEFALKQWNGKVEWVIGLDLVEAGPLVQSRITGSFEGVRSQMPGLPQETFVRFDGRGMKDSSQQQIKAFLQRHPKARHILIAAANDSSALGAVAAARVAKREKHIAVIGHDCLEEMQLEMNRKDTCAVASISHEVAQYGPRLLELGLALLHGETVAPYNFVHHRAVRGSLLSGGITSKRGKKLRLKS